MSILDAMQADIARIFGDVYRDAELTRSVTNTGGTEFDPTVSIGDPTIYQCKAIVEDWSKWTHSQGMVESQDRKLTILQNTLAVEPQIGDRIEVAGYAGRYTIVGEGGQAAISSDPARGGWVCRVRL